MTFHRRLSSTKREELYDAEAAKALAAGLGELPICNICNGPINGRTQAWDESHEKHKPKWLGGVIEGIAHRRCNRKHNNTHDTPLYAKTVRQRQRDIGAKVSSSRPMVGTFASDIHKPLRFGARPVRRSTGQEI